MAVSRPYRKRARSGRYYHHRRRTIMPIYKTLTPLRHTNTPKIVQLKVQGYVEIVSTNAGANILSAVSIAWCNSTVYDGDPAQGAATLVLGPDSVGRWRSVVSQYD